MEKRTESNSETASLEKPAYAHHQHVDPTVANINAKLANPLAGIPHDRLMKDAVAFAHAKQLGHIETDFAKGALVAQDPTSFEHLDMLDGQLRLCDAALVQERLDLGGGGIRRG